MVDRVLGDASAHGGVPDFVLCIGDDRSDEDMFLAIEHVTFSPHMPAEVRRHRQISFLRPKSP